MTDPVTVLMKKIRNRKHKWQRYSVDVQLSTRGDIWANAGVFDEHGNCFKCVTTRGNTVISALHKLERELNLDSYTK